MRGYDHRRKLKEFLRINKKNIEIPLDKKAKNFRKFCSRGMKTT
jgi:hypothetical protein